MGISQAMVDISRRYQCSDGLRARWQREGQPASQVWQREGNCCCELLGVEKMAMAPGSRSAEFGETLWQPTKAEYEARLALHEEKFQAAERLHKQYADRTEQTAVRVGSQMQMQAEQMQAEREEGTSACKLWTRGLPTACKLWTRGLPN